MRDAPNGVRGYSCFSAGKYPTENGGRKEAMIDRFDHRPMLTAVLALSTTVLVVVVITLSALLITSAPADSGGGNAGAAAPAKIIGAGGEHYGDEWNNYGHDFDQPKPAQAGNDGNAPVDRYVSGVGHIP